MRQHLHTNRLQLYRYRYMYYIYLDIIHSWRGYVSMSNSNPIFLKSWRIFSTKTTEFSLKNDINVANFYFVQFLTRLDIPTTLNKRLKSCQCFFSRWEIKLQRNLLDTVSPNKHGNSMTILNLSTSAQLSCKLNVLWGCVPATRRR